MNANKIRQLATEEFMIFGLGAKLTHQANSFINDRDFNGERVVALGSIVERTLWISLGRWLGYLDPVVGITRDELAMLREYRTELAAEDWPELFREVTRTLVSMNDDKLDDPLISSELPQNEETMFPIFQAATHLIEDLTEPQITIFFRYLQYGYKDIFDELPEPGALFDVLRQYNELQHVASDLAKPELVLAGFIRYTEFLSAMSDLFPSVNEYETATTDEQKAMQSSPRELLAMEIAKIIQWRMPSDREGAERYQVARMAFFRIVGRQVEAYPSLAIQWTEQESYGTLIHLSNRFFAVTEWVQATEFEPDFEVEGHDLKADDLENQKSRRLWLGTGKGALEEGDDHEEGEDEEDYDVNA